MPEVPAVSGIGDRPARSRTGRPGACRTGRRRVRARRSAGACAGRLRAARGSDRNGQGDRRRVRVGRRRAGRGRNRHRQDACLPRPRHPQRRTRPRLHRHQEPPGADLLQGHPGAAQGARDLVHRHLHEGAGELSVSASARRDDRAGSKPGRPALESSSARSHDLLPSSLLPIVQEWSARTETGDRAELEDLPEDLPFWTEISATAETCLGNECPRYDDCFVTRMRQRAAASDVVIVNHHLLCADASVRQSTPRRGHPRLQSCDRRRSASARGGRDAVFRFQRQQLSGRRARPRHRTPGRRRRTSPIARRRTRSPRRSRSFGIMAVTSSPRSPFAHRGNGRLRGEERVRATETSLADTRESAADLSGALDLVESTLALLNTPATPGQPGGEDGIAGGHRRAGASRRGDARRAALHASRR